MRFSLAIFLGAALFWAPVASSASFWNCWMPLLRLRLASEPVATVSTATLTKLEGKGFAKILSRSPDFWRDMGWQLTDGILATDSLIGMNDRILKARKSTGRAVPAFTFYWDTSEVGIDKFEFARGLAQGRVPISFRGVGRGK